MILFAVKAVRALLVLTILFGGWVLFRQKLSRKALLQLAVLIVFFAFASNWLAGFLPPLTDEVQLTALGERNDNAKSSEVYLAGYTIDNVSFISGVSLEIVEGHWFWSGETYAWRPEADNRQPDGMTRTVVLKIPVGWSRTLNFSGGIYRGLVEISAGKDRWVEDTYSADYSGRYAGIGRSETSKLIWNQIRYLAVYAVILLLCAVSTYFIVSATLRKPKQARMWLKENNGKLICGGIAFLTFALMFHYADQTSLWVDEMFEISFTMGTLGDAFQMCLKGGSANPPLEGLFYTIWYHIAPYGEKWLLLPSMLLTAASIFLTGVIGQRLCGNCGGIFAAIMAASSIPAWNSVAHEYRSYAFFLFFATLTLYCHVRRNYHLESKHYHVLFSLSLVGMAMSHYWGMIAMAGYFIADLYLLFKKRITWHAGMAFFTPGILSVLWISAWSMNHSVSISEMSFWSSVPKISDILNYLKYLSGGSDISLWIVCMGIAGAIYCLVAARVEFTWERFYCSFSVLLIAGIILGMYVYGKYINPKMTLWVVRYFIFLFPNAYILPPLAASNIARLCGAKALPMKALASIACIFIGICLSLNCVSKISTSGSSETWRESANWIYQQTNHIFNEDTLIVVTENNYGRTGWCEYYVTRQGRRDPLNVLTQGSLDKESLLQYNRIYLVTLHAGLASWLKSALNESYTLKSSQYGVHFYVRTS